MLQQGLRQSGADIGCNIIEYTHTVNFTETTNDTKTKRR